MSKPKWRRRKVPRWLVGCAPHQAIGSLIPPDVCFGAGCPPKDLISRRLSSPCYGGPRVRIHLPPPASPRTLGPSRDEIRPGRQAAAQHSSKAEPDQADSLACHILPRRWCGCEKSAAFVSVLDGDGHWVEYNDPVFGERMPEATA